MTPSASSMRARWRVGLDAQHAGVARERAGADAEHRAAAGQVVEQDDAVGDVERVVVGEADDAGAEADALRALAGGGEEDLRAGDDLPAAGVVLADPRLVVAELVEALRRARGRGCSASVGFSPRGGRGP